jgi:YVTN family beta-propeller protein
MNLRRHIAVALLVASALVRPAAAQPSPTLLVLNKVENSLAFVDPATGKVLSKVPTGDGPHEVVTDGTRAYVGNYGALVLISDLDAGELVVVDARARGEVKRLPLGRSPEGILVEPGGARAYVAVTGDNVVAVVNLKTLQVIGRIETGTGSDGMAWVAR